MRKKILTNIKKLDTPFYLYDKHRINANMKLLKKNLLSCGADIYYAVKANTSIAVLRTIKDGGFGAEVVSPGELYTVRKAGFAPDRILYNTIARQKSDIFFALRYKVGKYNFEALDQAEILEACARKVRKKIEIFARINPGIFPDTHPHLSTGAPSSKFGLEIDQLNAIARRVQTFRYARMTGIHSHIGSQILNPVPFIRNANMVATVIEFFRTKNITIRAVNLGGGFGIPYHPSEKPLNYGPIVNAYKKLAERYNVAIMLEPGRSVVGSAGCIVTRVISVKRRRKCPLYIIDAGMTENPRPALYRAYHGIDLITPSERNRRPVRIAGPLCENSDEFGIYRLPKLECDDMLLIRDCGAYTRTMATNYNGRLLVPEYMIENDYLVMIRKAQRLASLVRDEIY